MVIPSYDSGYGHGKWELNWQEHIILARFKALDTEVEQILTVADLMMCSNGGFSETRLARGDTYFERATNCI